MKADLQFRLVNNPDQETLAPIESGLHEYNLAHLGQKTLSQYHKLAILAEDSQGQTVGGIWGEIFWEWLYIHTLWVAEDNRGRGVGSRLLAQIETAAAELGVHQSHLETTDFQALEFYRRNGYEIFGQLEGKPAGHTWYYIQKRWDQT